MFYREWNLEVSYESYTDNPQNVFYTLKSFVGYYGYHYMSFIFEDDSWHLCEDSKVKSIGDFDELLLYIEKWKIIPYLVFYERVYRVSRFFQKVLSFWLPSPLLGEI